MEKSKKMREAIDKLESSIKNKQLLSDITWLLQVSYENDCEIIIEDSIKFIDTKRQRTIEIVIDYKTNDLKMIYDCKKSKTTEIMQIINNGEIVEIKDKEVTLNGDNEVVFSAESYKKYFQNYLTTSTYTEEYKSSPEQQASYVYKEEIYAMKNAKAVKKISVNAEPNSGCKIGTSYLKTAQLQNNLYSSNEIEIVKIVPSFDLSNEDEYNEFICKYNISRNIPSFINVKYTGTEGVDEISGILLDANDKTVSLLIGDDEVYINYDKIISINICNNILYEKEPSKKMEII